jgi:peroxin-5
MFTDVNQGPQILNPRRWQSSPLRYGPMTASRPEYSIQSDILDQDYVTKAIQSLELNQQVERASENPQRMSSAELDDLARTAAMLMEAVKDEESPKFRNSSFMSLMKRLRDRELVVEGNDFRQASGSSWAAEFGVSDRKDKGKARADQSASNFRQKSVHFESDANVIEERDITNLPLEVETELDRYLRQENEEYSLLQGEIDRAVRSSSDLGRNNMVETIGHHEWGVLQADWDRFEATAVGIRPTSVYSFQQNNPYLGRNVPTTRHHLLHQTARLEVRLYRSPLS